MAHRLKLQPPRATRTRVWQVARDLGVAPSQALRVLQDLGEYVPSVSSGVEVPAIRRLYQFYGRAYTPPSDTRWSPGDDSPVPLILTPPARRARRDNNPLLGEVTPQSSIATELPAPLEPAVPSRVWSTVAEAEMWGDLMDGRPSPAFEYEQWKLLGFTEVERDVWIDAGLRPWAARVAHELRALGMAPYDLQADLNGWRVIDRLQRGEGARAVVELLNRTRRQAS